MNQPRALSEIDTKSLLWQLPQQRRERRRKTVLVVGGVRGGGAAALRTAETAALFGASVSVAAPESTARSYASFFGPEELVALPETRSGSISRKALPELLRLASRADAVIVSPELSANTETKEVVRAFLKKLHLPRVVVVDGTLLDWPFVSELEPPVIALFGAREGAKLFHDFRDVASGARSANKVLVWCGERFVAADSAVTVADGQLHLPAGGTGLFAGLIGGVWVFALSEPLTSVAAVAALCGALPEQVQRSARAFVRSLSSALTEFEAA